MADTQHEQASWTISSLPDTLARLEQERLDHLREIDILKLAVQRYKNEAASAKGHAAMLQVALDRHMAHCIRDEGNVQRLKAELQEANAQRKEQVKIISRRETRIQSLQEQLNSVSKSIQPETSNRPQAPIFSQIWNPRASK